MKWIIAILIFGLLVIFHEFGHMLAAKMEGVRVEEFSVGFGPRIVSAEFRGTRYSLKLFPFGGSCAMEDESGEAGKTSGTSFSSKTPGQRARIVFAGPLFNIILAFIASIILVSCIGYDPAYVTNVEDGSPAAEAGLVKGDEVTSFMGSTVDVGRDVTLYTSLEGLKPGEPVTMSVKRDGRVLDISYVPSCTSRYMLGIGCDRDDTPAEIASLTLNSPLAAAGVMPGDIITSINGTEIQSGSELFDYLSKNPLGTGEITITYSHDGSSHTRSILPVLTSSVDSGFDINLARTKTDSIGVLHYSCVELRYWTGVVFKSLGLLLTGRVSVSSMSGPVGVVDTVGSVYEKSAEGGPFIQFMSMLLMISFLSVNLGIMNLLPIPAVDGGRLLFILIEAVRGKPMDRNIENAIQFASMGILICFMLYVMGMDIMKLS